MSKIASLPLAGTKTWRLQRQGSEWASALGCWRLVHVWMHHQVQTCLCIDHEVTYYTVGIRYTLYMAFPALHSHRRVKQGVACQAETRYACIDDLARTRCGMNFEAPGKCTRACSYSWC